jgi:uncharacterized RDD family membrane protein YckC
VAKLIVNPSSSQRREISLPRTVLSIGRDPSNDLVLPDAMVSRRHAVVEWRGSQFYIRDCNSSNGSLVNGDRVSEKGLRDGDLVAIGTARLLFRDEVEDVSGKVVQHPSSRHVLCPSCNAEYRKGDLFCRQCGASLAPAQPSKVVCTACGTAVLLPARFCNACGTRLPVQGGSPSPSPKPSGAAGAASAAPALSSATQPDAGAEVAPEREPRHATPTPAPARDPEPEEPQSSAVPRPASAPSPATIPPGGEPPAPDGESGPVSSAPPTPARRLDGLPRLAPAVDGSAAPPLPQPTPARPAARPTPREVRRAVASPRPAGRPSAPAGLRLLAALVDALVVSAAQAALLAPVAQYWWSRELPAAPSEVGAWPLALTVGAVPIALLLGAAYFVWGWGVAGATPGKRLLSLRVEGHDGRFPIGPGRAFLRLIGYGASTLLLGLGFLLIPLVGEGLHDKIAGTRVVRREGD